MVSFICSTVAENQSYPPGFQYLLFLVHFLSFENVPLFSNLHSTNNHWTHVIHSVSATENKSNSLTIWNIYSNSCSSPSPFPKYGYSTSSDFNCFDFLWNGFSNHLSKVRYQRCIFSSAITMSIILPACWTSIALLLRK